MVLLVCTAAFSTYPAEAISQPEIAVPILAPTLMPKEEQAYLQVLDEILPAYMTAGEVNLGLIDIPIDKIVGTKTKGRTHAFAANFMPLLSEDSEFGLKWRNLCNAHLSDADIRDPISCYEFLGRFYVQEGNKRVSVLKYFGATSIPGNVIRILPLESTSKEVRAYREFLT